MFSEEALLESRKKEAERSTPDALVCSDTERVSLCELLDRILNKGVVVAGALTISVADVDLLSLDLRLVLTSAAILSKKWQPGSVTVSGDK
jgi:Gas vesicle protein